MSNNSQKCLGVWVMLWGQGMCGEATLWTESIVGTECLGQGFPLKDFLFYNRITLYKTVSFKVTQQFMK